MKLSKISPDHNGTPLRDWIDWDLKRQFRDWYAVADLRARELEAAGVVAVIPKPKPAPSKRREHA